MQSFPSREEMLLGVRLWRSFHRSSTVKQEKTTKFSDEDWYLTGKYTSADGPGATVRNLESPIPFKVWWKYCQKSQSQISGVAKE